MHFELYIYYAYIQIESGKPINIKYRLPITVLVFLKYRTFMKNIEKSLCEEYSLKCFSIYYILNTISFVILTYSYFINLFLPR